MHTLTVTTADGFDLAAQVSGQTTGPTLLLLAGQANSHRWWTGLRQDFEDSFRVVTLDQRGTGNSRGPVGDWTTAVFAQDALAVLDAVGSTAAKVYATSMGGRVAQVLAATEPAAVDRMVLACTSPGGPHAQERSTEVRRSLADPDTRRRVAALHNLFYTPAWPHPPGHSHLLGDKSMGGPETRAHLRASAKHDAWDLLSRIEAPTLVLHGTDDQMTPAGNARLLADHIGGARLHLLDGGRHGFFDEFRELVVPLVRGFLT